MRSSDAMTLERAKRLFESGRLEEAATAIQLLVDESPADGKLWFELAQILRDLGRFLEALSAYREATKLLPGNPEPAKWLGLCVEACAGEYPPVQFLDDVELCLSNSTLDPGRFSVAVSELYLDKAEVRNLLGQMDRDGISLPDETVVLDAISTLSDPVFRRVMAGAVIFDHRLEQVFTAIRAFLLRKASEGTLAAFIPEKNAKFLPSLACQCFLNEYVYFIGPDEEEWLSAIMESGSIDPTVAMLLACYRSISDWEETTDLGLSSLAADLPETDLVIRLQKDEPQEEAILKQSIQSISDVINETSLTVRDQYEQNPYPRWQYLDVVEEQSPETYISQKIPGFSENTMRLTLPEEPCILIAGSGTGQLAIETAMTLRTASVTALDLSFQSLAYGMRKSKEKNVSNLTFVQGDILELSKEIGEFDLIETNGVLHHLKDPTAGWRALTGLLKSGGFMQVGLYSELGRQDVVAARQLILEQGWETSDDGIRAFRKSVMSLSDDDFIRQIMGFRDFYTLSECRDLVFHVMEHRFTLPQIAGILDNLGLEFLGFEGLSPEVTEAIRTRVPSHNAFRSLETWDAVERQNPALFANMYLFWLRKT